MAMKLAPEEVLFPAVWMTNAGQELMVFSVRLSTFPRV